MHCTNYRLVYNINKLSTSDQYKQESYFGMNVLFYQEYRKGDTVTKAIYPWLFA